MRSTARNRTVEVLLSSEIDLRILSSSLTRSEGRALCSSYKPDAFAGEGIAIEQRNQLHQAAHVAAAVQNEQQIRRRIYLHDGIRVREFLDHFAQLVDVDIFQKDQVEHELIVSGNILAR